MTALAAPRQRPELGPRRWAIWGAVTLGACGTLSLAAHSLVAAPPSRSTVYGVLALVALAWMGERWLVPVADSEMSLAAVPITCAAVMYGAALAAAVAATAFVLEAVRRREHPVRLVFNAAVWALMGGAAGLAAHVHPGNGMGLIVAVVLAAGGEEITNIGLVALMTAEAKGREFLSTAWSITRIVTLPFVLSLSIVPLFVLAWDAHPYLAITAIGPLAAVALHMRSLEASRQATKLALTDPLTGLGNRRSLNERLQRELDRADVTGAALSVCVFDVDGFKEVNDTRGHHAGDDTLVAVAGVLRQGGEAFRLGGDEFVLVLPAHDTDAVTDVAVAVTERVRKFGLTISTGMATYMGDGAGRGDLLRTADERLYLGRATRRPRRPRLR